MTMRPIVRKGLANLLFSTKLPHMKDTETEDTRTPNEKKTGKTLKEGATDCFSVRQALTSTEAIKKYDNYLKEHSSRLRQLHRVANGEMAPSSRSYL